MGQKIHPVAFRLGINKNWASRWFATKDQYAENLVRDAKIRRMIGEKVKDAGVAKIEIERSSNRTEVIIHTSKPGIIIGRQGASINELVKHLTNKANEKIELRIQEIKDPDISAPIVAEGIGRQISNRMSFRRAAKQALGRAMENGAQGIKVLISGRLNGADIARSEAFIDGNVPLHTLRADIDYAVYHAPTTYGVIGIRVWIYRGEVFEKSEQEVEEVKRPADKVKRPRDKKPSKSAKKTKS